ncbi:MAG TPA: hypothetical protein PKC76_01870 [Saprospiraceae bacterium]|nr:hypothetical protein [Saprospiraceae bacterium]HMP22844.1 hypothetical protein [Saprospiraceae bacterium]
MNSFVLRNPPLRQAPKRCSRYLAALGILNNGSRADAGAALGASLRSAPSRAVLLRSFVLNGQESASNRLRHIHVK